jgi:hypothetical protein
MSRTIRGVLVALALLAALLAVPAVSDAVMANPPKEKMRRWVERVHAVEFVGGLGSFLEDVDAFILGGDAPAAWDACRDGYNWLLEQHDDVTRSPDKRLNRYVRRALDAGTQAFGVCITSGWTAVADFTAVVEPMRRGHRWVAKATDRLEVVIGRPVSKGDAE